MVNFAPSNRRRMRREVQRDNMTLDRYNKMKKMKSTKHKDFQRSRFLTGWSILLYGLLLCASSCRHQPVPSTSPEMETYERFFAENIDSVALAPRPLRAKIQERITLTQDSLVRYLYLSMTLKTYLITAQYDSAWAVIRHIGRFIQSQSPSARLADLRSDCLNMAGNLYSRTGYSDSARLAFHQAYLWRMQGLQKKVVPDILINLADACNRLGRLDEGAAWYRRALYLCDSLQLPSTHKYPIYYGLGQIYVTLRDFDQCDYYFNLAARYYDQMMPYEKYIYLNNRGTSYYYRDEYLKAMNYFQQVIRLAGEYPDMRFELNLARLNLSDCYLRLGEADSASFYMQVCRPFFEEMGVTTALYYLDTQTIELALLKSDLIQARQTLLQSVTPPGIDPEMLYIRYNYLRQFFEKTGDYYRAYRYQSKSRRLDDSIRNERVSMRTADLALRYQQDSTLLAHRVQIREAENEVLLLRQTQLIVLVIAIIILLLAGFIYMYSKKKRALLQAESRRQISSLRLENIRSRLSPHFIFNVLNQEIANPQPQAADTALPLLVKLMRRNLELAEQLSVTLAEELDFVNTYIDLERRSMGPLFHFHLYTADNVLPECQLIPSMLIQIPVENALKHALRGKEGERNLWINIHRTPDGQCHIEITDNGGGYRPHSPSRGTGTGMKVVMQTIQILNSRNNEHIDVNVHDVSLPCGETGCQVSFTIPSDYRYKI